MYISHVKTQAQSDIQYIHTCVTYADSVFVLVLISVCQNENETASVFEAIS